MVTQRKRPSGAWRFLRFVGLAELTIAAVVVLVCLVGGWRTLGDYANGLTYAGIVVMALGGLRYFASDTGTIDPGAGYHSTNLSEHHQRVQRGIAESDSAFVVMLKLGLVGLVAIALGQVIKAALS
jgi:hypothetical protein